MQAKPLSIAEIRKNATTFVAEWAGETYEKGESQSFWTDLLAVYGVNRRKVARFEAKAQRLDGGTGFIDLFWPGMLIAEQKSAGKDLVKAEQQAMDYLDSVPDAEQPRYVVTSNFEEFRLRDLDTPPGEDPVATFPLADLPVEAERFGFIAGYQKRAFGTTEQAEASVKAAKLMADLYVELEKTGYDEHEASIFLVRTLFALFADDSGLWERDLFLEFIETRTSEDGSDLGAQMAVLFQTLDRPANKRLTSLDPLLARFPYVNGTVFGETISIPYFDRSMRDKLIEASHFQWASISPAIFGSLFQAVKSKEARRDLGEHYTTETNIKKVIEPLFLDEARQRFVDSQHDLKKLRQLHRDIGEMRFLDPACGCGNFLIVAYREMRALELDILVRIQELDRSRQQTSLVLEEDNLVRVRMSSFYGIELEEWPSTIAKTAMFLVQHQANQDLALKVGISPDMLPLTESATIVTGNALETDWNQVLPASDQVVIMGNPPFIGARLMGDSQKREIEALWPKGKAGILDYCTGWHMQAMRYFANSPQGRFAFVTTNSIAQGQQVPPLFGTLLGAGWRVSFAHRTFTWTSEAPGAAAVHCVIVGFDRGHKTPAKIFAYENGRGHPRELPAANINPYLADAPDVLVEPRSKVLASDLAPAMFGSMANDGGNLVVEVDEYSTVSADPIAAKYLRRFVGARELVRGLDRWCLWLVDAPASDISASPILKERVRAVLNYRAESKRAATRCRFRSER